MFKFAETGTIPCSIGEKEVRGKCEKCDGATYQDKKGQTTCPIVPPGYYTNKESK